MTGRWFSPGTQDSSTNRTDSHDITEILFKVALNTITPSLVIFHVFEAGGSDLNITFIEMELLWSNAKDYCFIHGGILESDPVELTQRYNGHEDYWTGIYSNTGWTEWAVVWGKYKFVTNFSLHVFS